MNVSEPKVAALEAEGELFVIQPEQVKDRGVQVVDLRPVFHGIETSSSVFPRIVPDFTLPPANHIVKALM